MKTLLQSVLLLAEAGDLYDNQYGPKPYRPSDYSYWWVIAAVLVVIALCCLILSVMSKGKASLWKDDNTEMDSGSFPDC